MPQYSEGQRLKGSDGQIYVVHGGVPTIENDIASTGGILIKPADPRRPFEAPIAQSQLQSAQDRNALAPFDKRKAAADATRSEAEAIIAQQKASEARATSALASMGPTSNVRGQAYLDKFVPKELQETVKAYARGDLGSRSGGMSASMLPIIQHALNFDPSASGTNFAARVKMQSDLAGSLPNTVGGALRAMERMLLHGREVLRSGQKLGNADPGLLGSMYNSAKTGYGHFTNDPTIHGYEELVRNYAPEAQKAIAQTSGGVEERKGREEAFGASLPQASRAAALQGDARQAFDAMGAANAQYKRLMGRDIIDALSPDARQAYDEIMAGGFDENKAPLHPVAGYAPIAASPTDAPPSAPPGNGNPYGYDPNKGGGGTGRQTLAQGASKDVRDPKTSKMIDTMVRHGATADQINAMLPKGYAGAKVLQSSVSEAQRYLRKNPGFKGSFGDATLSQPTTAMEQFSASNTGAFLSGAGNGITFGLGDELKGGLGSLAGGDYTAIRDQADYEKKALAAAHPTADLLGNITGAGLTSALPVGLVAKAGLTGKAALSANIALDAGLGGLYGAGENNSDRLSGAAVGALGGVAGGMFGRAAGVPAAALLRTAPAQRGINAAGNAFRGIKGEAPVPFQPLPKNLAASDSSIFSAANTGGIDDITARLTEAQRLGVPMSLADTHPALTSLAGAAVRRSPNADAIAQNAFIPRSRGQIDRLGNAVTRDLGPVGNIPQISADMTAQARTAAGPLYDRAYSRPVISTPELDATLGTPFGRDALGRARTIAANERR